MKFFSRKATRAEPQLDEGAVAADSIAASPQTEPSKADLRGLPKAMGYMNTAQTVMAVNRGLLLANILTAVAVLALAVGLVQSREWITVYIPPSTAQGGFATAGTPSAATVYGFAGLLLQQLYHWPIDGESDYAKAIEAQRLYLTPAFRRALLEDFAKLRNRSGLNELRGRARALHPAPDRLYSPERVTAFGNGVWGVALEYRLVESIAASPIKDVAIRYEVRVVRAEVNPAGNKWGLQLDGWLRDPVRLVDEE